MEEIDKHESEEEVQENGNGEDQDVTAEEQETSLYQEPESVAMNHVDSKEDMFVDAPEELNLDGRETAANTDTETEEEKPLDSPSHIDGMENGTPGSHSVDELKRLEAVVGKTVGEKESIEREYQEEREILSREVRNLRSQLIALSAQQSISGENGGHVVEEETGNINAPLHEVVNECSQLIKFASEERIQTENTIRELREVLYMKDQHIQDLSAKVQLGENVEVVVDNMLASLGMVVYQEELLDSSFSGKLSHVERSTYMLMEKYNQMFYEIDQLRQCLSEPGSLLRVQEEFVSVFSAARGELVELKRKEAEVTGRISHLEHENGKLAEQIMKERILAEEANAELGRTRVELEQEKNRCANIKEKLSLAVTKGKALVQQRDLLKQSIAEKTSELEKCRLELQEKSSGLEAAELCKEELLKCEVMVTSLQETLSQKHEILKKLEETLSPINIPEEVQSLDIIERFNWLMDERSILFGTSTEFQKLKEGMSLIDLPENVLSSDLQSQVSWLQQSFEQANSEANVLLHEIEMTKESAHKEIDRLSASLSAELQEKDYIKTELDDLASKHEEIVNRAHQISLEKDQMMRLLLDGSGTTVEEQEEIYQSPDGLAMLVDRCFMNVKKQNSACPDTSHVDTELFERIQSLLYVKDQELMLCEELLEEEVVARSEINNLSNDLRTASQELTALKEEKVSLQKDVERLEEKSSLLREKLSMAVKKGKGLVQDRENLKNLMDEKNSEIGKLKVELQQKESTVEECSDCINRLSTDLADLKNLMDEKNSETDRLKVELQQKESAVTESSDCINRMSTDLVYLKNLMDEKNSETEMLKVELQQKESTVSECTDCINKLSSELADLVAMKDQRDQLEKFLLESNNRLQKVIESVDGIGIPVDSVSKEPVQKLNWLAGYFNESQQAKADAELEFGKLKEEANTLVGKFAEAQRTIRSLEDALTIADNNVSQLVEGKRKLEVVNEKMEQELQKVKEEADTLAMKLAEALGTIESLEHALAAGENNVSQLAVEKREIEEVNRNIQQELQKVKEEANTHLEQEFGKVKEETNCLTGKLAEAQGTIKSLEDALSVAEENVTEACAARKSLEDALSLAENNISTLIKEKEEAVVGKAAIETELEEVAIQTKKLTEAYKTIKSLEDTLAKVETDVALLTQQNKDAEVGRTNLEKEQKKLQDKTESQASELADAFSTIKSLEDALSNAENDVTGLEVKRMAEQEISTLNSKLNACMEELAGSNGSLESKSLEFITLLDNFQVLMKDESLLSMVKRCFDKKFENLKDMDLILKDIRDHFVNRSSEVLQSHPFMQEDIYLAKPLLRDLEDTVNLRTEDGEVNAADGDNISICFRKTVEGFQLRNKLLADNFESCSTFVDGFISALLSKLKETRDAVKIMSDYMESLNQKIKNMEIYEQESEKTLATLENDATILLAACSDAITELDFEVKNNLMELKSIPELEKLKYNSFVEEREGCRDDTAYHQQRVDSGKHVETAEKLLSVTRRVHTLTRVFESTSNVAAIAIEELQKELEENRVVYEKVIGEKDEIKNRVSELENDVEALQNTCRELKFKVDDYEALNVLLKEKEAELSSLHNSLQMKEQAIEESILSASQANSLFEKISDIEVPFPELEIDDSEHHSSDPVKKLFYIVDSVTELQHKINVLSHDKQELQLTLTRQTLEIKHLKEEIKTQISDEQEAEQMKNEISELAFDMQKLVKILGVNEILGDPKSLGIRGILPVLEKHAMALFSETENSKSEAQELGRKLVESEKVEYELAMKIKLLEDSLQSRATQSEIVQERSIFEPPPPTAAEISEVDDLATGQKNAISSVPSAAHVRTMRKGSTDHLALNVDLESGSLINSGKTDEDKGHVFKSLNTSGLVPKQGKVIADRIDGIWVSGGGVLMSRPRARLGVIAYCLLLHLWVLGTIL
ncbi:hypothetical protein HS088_TW06G00683 [Tripterygium wilfordii]|uniref:Uncharacterized protein n=1 Tax=Tripterygium wilfordii TaxID=458696 RepID=A0A7J7DJH8_TRIWF|nr:myosin-10 [Tripterygium wilfordii]KAF5746512.1 hypothetical protein HS088_TW06G00683 [Tripterygium wilfordii]